MSALRALSFLTVLFFAGGAAAHAATKGAIKVTHLAGEAAVERAKDKSVSALALGAEVAEGDTVETKAGAKLELSLPDGSKLRLAEKSKVTLTEGRFGEKGERNVTASLWLGRLWAQVAKSIGGKDTFEVGTRNAVAGVRGTSFTVAAEQDLSSVVRVYAGTVGVRKGEGTGFSGQLGARKQVPGPSRVDKKQWEEIIAGAMKQVKVSSAGEISPAQDFEDSGEELKWAMWNKERDR